MNMDVAMYSKLVGVGADGGSTTTLGVIVLAMGGAGISENTSHPESTGAPH